MATVPRLELTGTTPGALPGVKQSSVASPELFGAAAAQDAAFATATGGAGDVLFKAAMEEAERASVAAVQDARTELGRRSQLFVEDLRKNNVGQAAAGSAQAFSDWHGKQVEEIGKGLQGRETQRAFGVMAKQHSVAGRSDVASFENSETVKYRADSYNRANDGYVQQAAMATTDASYIDARNNLVGSVMARAKTENWDQAQKDDNMRDALSKMHEARAKALATDVNGAANPRAALEYIKGVDAKEINPLVRAQLTAGLKSQTDQQNALDKVTDLMVKFTPANKEDPIQFEKLDAELRAQFKDNPEALRAARAEAQFRTTNYNADLQQVEAKSLSSLFKMYNDKMSPADIKKSEAYVNAGEKAKMQFNKMMDDEILRREQIAATRASRASAEESRAYTKIMRDAHILERTNLADTLRFLNPDEVRGVPEERILALQGKLGLENMQKVHTFWRSVNASAEKMQDAKIDSTTFAAVAHRAGILPNDDSKATNSQKADAVILRNSIDDEMSRVQQITKKPLTREERDSAIQRVVDAQVLESRWYWRDKVIKPQTMDNKEILERVPDAKRDEDKNPERRYAEEMLREQKIPVSDYTVARLWRTQMIVRPQQFIREANIRYTKTGQDQTKAMKDQQLKDVVEKRAAGG